MSGVCAVCLDKFHDPRIIPCGHTFCFGCTKQLVSTNGEIRCPKCRKIHKVEVVSLPTNWEVCSETWEDRQCHSHAEMKKYWCNNCSKSVCGDCLLDGEHKGHEYVKGEVMIARFRKEVQQQLDEMTICKQKSTEIVQLIDLVVDMNDNNFTSATNNIKMAYRTLLADIEEQRDKSLSSLARLHSAKNQELKQARSNFSNYLNQIGNLEKSYQELLHSDDVDATYTIKLKKAPTPASFPTQITSYTFSFQPTLPTPPKLQEFNVTVPPRMQIIVKHHQKHKMFEISPMASIASLKEMVAKTFSYDLQQFALLSELTGKWLRDDNKIFDYNIQQHSCLLLKYIQRPPNTEQEQSSTSK